MTSQAERSLVNWDTKLWILGVHLNHANLTVNPFLYTQKKMSFPADAVQV